MNKIKNVKVKKVKGRNMQFENCDVDGMFVLADGGMINFRNCRGRIAVVCKKDTVIFFDEGCNCEVSVAPFSFGVVTCWNAKAAENVTPYFSEWFKG